MAVVARPLVAGTATGRLVVLDEPLSFWGGFDSATGDIIDRHHPQRGRNLSGRVVMMRGSRGSSSSSSVLAEAVRVGTAPCAILLTTVDEILVLGSVVAEEVYGKTMAVMLLSSDDYVKLSSWAGSQASVRVSADGAIRVAE